MRYGTPNQAYTNSVPDQQSLYPDGQHTLVFYIKCVQPVGHETAVLAVKYEIMKRDEHHKA